ncbi:hypothetical protein ACSBL2_16455 [Pedobacter sp. AW31-3R]|uniref:hypothetical protein n=1 Tax=Pedobacter sp. AW31-3R TaxID=3445781 RepID=UPI003F9F5FD4
MEHGQYIQGKLFGDMEKSDQKEYETIYPQYLERIEKLQQVIRKLREDTLGSGHCFMVFDERLEEDEAFYEYPEGHIHIERLDKNNIEVPRQVVRRLNRTEIKALRSKHAVIR